MSETDAVAKYLAELRFEDLPDAVIERAKWAIGDALAVGLYASTLEWSRVIANHAKWVSGTGTATIWGTGETASPPLAAMANGTAVHGIELDDRSFDLNVHNGAATIPAALALAEHEGADGRQVILATVCGYELAFRVARATRGIRKHYWHSIRAIFGAVAASAKVLALTGSQMRDAIGIAGSAAGGLWAFKYEPTGTMVKRLQGGGWTAASGVTAAMLAGRGLDAPSTILEGEDGLCHSFNDVDEPPNIKSLAMSLGASFEMLNWETKWYAAWGGGHSSIEAVGKLVKDDRVEPDQVRKIRVYCSSKPYSNAQGPYPKSIMAAQYSLPFLIASAFYVDLTDPAVWTERILDHEGIARIFFKVEAIIDPKIESILQQTNDHGGVRLELEMHDGTTKTEEVRHAKGTPSNPLRDSELESKLRLLSAHRLGKDNAERLVDWVRNLDHSSDPCDLRWLRANDTNLES